MPIYEYTCTVCSNRFEKLKPFSKMNEPTTCPDCGGPSKKQLSVFLSLSTDSSGRTTAVAGGGGGCCGGGSGGCACAAGT